MLFQLAEHIQIFHATQEISRLYTIRISGLDLFRIWKHQRKKHVLSPRQQLKSNGSWF